MAVVIPVTPWKITKYYYDRKIQPKTYKIGDWIWLLKPRREKLEPQYSGPYQVIEILKNNNMKIAINSKQIKIIHMNRVKEAYLP